MLGTFWKAEFRLIVSNGDFGMTLNVGDGIWKALVGDGCVYFPPPVEVSQKRTEMSCAKRNSEGEVSIFQIRFVNGKTFIAMTGGFPKTFLEFLLRMFGEMVQFDMHQVDCILYPP